MKTMSGVSEPKTANPATVIVSALEHTVDVQCQTY